MFPEFRTTYLPYMRCAAVIAFDVVFAEADVSSGLPVMENLAKKELAGVPQFASVLAQIRPQLDYDAIEEKLREQSEQYR